MRHRKIADLPLASTPVSLRPAQAANGFDPVPWIVTAAMGLSFVYLALRIAAQI